MEQMLSRLILVLTLGCLLSITAVGHAAGHAVVQIAVALQPQISDVVPKNYAPNMIDRNARVPRIDPLDLPVRDAALQPELTGVPLGDVETIEPKRLPVQSDRALDSRFAELPFLHMLVFVQAPGNRSASGAGTTGGISRTYRLIIDVTVAETFQQPAPLAAQLPRAVLIGAAPYEDTKLSSAKGLSHVAPEPRLDVEAGRVFALSTAMSLQTLPVFGIAQPLPDH